MQHCWPSQPAARSGTSLKSRQPVQRGAAPHSLPSALARRSIPHLLAPVCQRSGLIAAHRAAGLKIRLVSHQHQHLLLARRIALQLPDPVLQAVGGRWGQRGYEWLGRRSAQQQVKQGQHKATAAILL